MTMTTLLGKLLTSAFEQSRKPYFEEPGDRKHRLLWQIEAIPPD